MVFRRRIELNDTISDLTFLILGLIFGLIFLRSIFCWNIGQFILGLIFLFLSIICFDETGIIKTLLGDD